MTITRTPDRILDTEAVARLQEGQPDTTILDVRTPAEFESAHIPGSYNVPLDLLPEHATELASTIGGPLVLVCQSGVRARQAEQALLGAELPRLHILDGGLTAWERQGLPVTRGRQRWAMERQVRGIAGGIVLASAMAGTLVARPLGLIAAGVGGGLLFSAVSNSCAMASVLARLPYNRGASCDIDAVLGALTTRTGTTAATNSSDRHVDRHEH